MAKKILMICYYYPPITDVGSKRSVAFSKYLKRFGWDPYVVSVKNPDKNYCLVGAEPPSAEIPVTYTYSLFSLSALSGKVNGFLIRVAKLFGKKLKTNYFYQFICIPDIFWGWIPLTVLKSARLIHQLCVDLIYVSCTPYTSAVIGLILKKITGRPLVVDFRDQRGIGAELEIEKFEVRLRRKIEKRFIQKVLQGADLFVVTSEEISRLYKTFFPQYAYKMATIYNGFDSEYIEPSRKLTKFGLFTIIYTGSFYLYAIHSMAFFEALQILKESKALTAETFQFLYYGDDYNKIQSCAEQYRIADLVKVHPRVPYTYVLQQLQQSHLQLIRIVKPMISTKVFEGISMDIPFLATIPPGEVEEMIHKFSPSSIVITEDSGIRVSEAIMDAWRSYKNGKIQPNRVGEFLAFYSRETQTRRLMAAIEGILSSAVEHSDSKNLARGSINL